MKNQTLLLQRYFFGGMNVSLRDSVNQRSDNTVPHKDLSVTIGISVTWRCPHDQHHIQS